MTDVKTIALTWLLNFFEKQGAGMLVTLGFASFFAWKTNRLEDRLDACQNAREEARIVQVEQVVQSSDAVIRAIETLIGKMETQSSPVIKTRFKK